MKNHCEQVCVVAASALLLISACTTESASQPETADGFKSLFDGKTLSGWRGDEDIWLVRDSAITGGSDDEITKNTFLIYESPYANFELRYSYRFSGFGNSGVHFRSTVIDEERYAVTGYQANVVPTNQAERFGMLYEEGGRHELALLGHRMVIDRDDDGVVKNVVESINPRDMLLDAIRPYPEWNDVVVIAYGNHIVHAVNGYLVFDAVDHDPAGRTEGIFALQVHSGPPMHVQYKDIAVKPLTTPPELAGRFVSKPGPPTPADPGPRVPAS